MYLNYNFISISKDYCPEYNTGANALDTVPCNAPTGLCPGELYLSNNVYKCEINYSFFNTKNEVLSIPTIM